ncbi:MAG: hypothetical protein A2Y14_04245 [Verrucomicrobia bacterium GWF2_51_19]|nr:MAG: hypothetical protein A2Y14_04245 [Verrucomicrobia bacterium GWF2_51_19]
MAPKCVFRSGGSSPPNPSPGAAAPGPIDYAKTEAIFANAKIASVFANRALCATRRKILKVFRKGSGKTFFA